jgi:multidrug transporter EmrE-like cation transporter
MHPKTLALILGAVLMSATGQILLKSGANRTGGEGSTGYLTRVFMDAHTLAGFTVWIASTVCWLYVLRVAPLSRAYGLTSLTYVLVFVAGVLLFSEPLRPVHAVGTALIVAGIACLAQGG